MRIIYPNVFGWMKLWFFRDLYVAIEAYCLLIPENMVCVSAGINVQNRNFCSSLISEGRWSREESYIFPFQITEWTSNRQTSDSIRRWAAWRHAVEPIPWLPTKFIKWKWRTKLVSVSLVICRVLHVSKNSCSVSTEVSIYSLGVLLCKTLFCPLLILGERKTPGD